MEKPTSLETSTDYVAALLWLMDRLGSRRASDVCAEFEKQLGSLIPTEHYELNSDGNQKWVKLVQWARYDLVNVGLMGSAGRGIWTITEDGHQWLRDHPDGGSLEIKRRVRQKLKPSRKVTSQPPLPHSEKSKAAYTSRSVSIPARDAFFGQIVKELPDHLATSTQHGRPKFFPGRNWVQFVYPEFVRSHYELRLARGFTEVAFHFEADETSNLLRLDTIAPHVAELSQRLNHPVIAERWAKSWARVAIDLQPEPLTSALANQYVVLLARFINETHGLLLQTFANTRRRQHRQQQVAHVTSNQTAHAVLDEQIHQIRQFLQGRASRPSDDILSDWVQFCYLFKMYIEGYQLFDLIDPSAVHPVLYQRAKKLATVCRIYAISS